MVQTGLEAGLGRTQKTGAAAPSGYRQRIDAPIEAFGGGSANAAATLGKGLDVAAQAAERQENIKATEEIQKFTRELNAKKFDGENGWLAKQGTSALGLSDKANKEMQELRETYLENLSPIAAQSFKQSADRLIDSTTADLSRYELGEQRAAETNVANSQIQLEMENVGLNYRNNQAIAESMEKVKSATIAMASLNGWPQEKLELELWNSESKVRSAQIAQLLASNNPQDVLAAEAMFKDAQQNGQLTLTHVNTLEQNLQTAVPKAQADIAYERFRGGSGSSLSEMPLDMVFNQGLLKQESGGRQFNNDGTVVTSSAGAIGVAQVMPATGPEAAEAAGLPWDEVRYRTDEGYNAALGKAYLEKTLMPRYKDKVELALMAYNGGMGNIDKHIKRVGFPDTPQKMESFIASYPVKETRDYVPSIMKRLGISGFGPGDAANPMEEMRRLEAAAPTDPEARKQFMAKYSAEKKAAEDFQKQQGEFVENAIMEQLYETNGDISALPTNMVNAAKRFKVWDKVSKYTGETDDNYKMSLINMSPDDLARHDIDRSRLDEGDYESFAKMKADSLKPEGKVVQGSINELANYYFRSIAGLNPEKDDQTKRAVAQFKSRLMVEAEAIKEIEGKPASMEKLSGIARNLMKANMNNGWFSDSFDYDKGFAIDVSDIDEEARQAIENSIMAEGKTPSEAEVLRRYPAYKRMKEAQNG